MRHKTIYNLIVILSISSLILPGFSFAAYEGSGVSAPQNIEEAKNLGIEILSKLPEAVKNVWQKEALPFWQKMWQWFLGFWNNVAWPIIDPWRQKLIDLLSKEVEKRRPAIEEEIKETAPVIGNSLWEKFKDLLR